MAERLKTFDELRGVAAVLVVLHHAGPTLLGEPLLPHAYLAVDFFFMLSGFVMAKAYDSRLAAGLAGADMMRSRLARLFPTIAIGILLGAVVTSVEGTSVWTALVRSVLQLLFIPLASGTGEPVYLLDGVQWSLFFELVANGAHALVLHRWSGRRLKASVVLGAVALALMCWFVGSAAVGDCSGDFLGGFVRVAFSYLAGVFLFRIRAAERLGPLPIPGFACAALLVGAILGPSLFQHAWWVDPLLIIGLFPLIVTTGATAVSGERFGLLAVFGGRLSYPLYAVHLPVLHAAAMAVAALGLGKGLGPLLLGCASAVAAAAGVEAMLRRTASQLGGSYLPVKFADLFSRKAATPSR